MTGPTFALLDAARRQPLPQAGHSFRLAGPPIRPQEPPKPQTMPPARTMLANVAAAAKRTLGGLLRGQPVIAENDLQARRHAICRDGCQYYAAASDRCAKCGCFLRAKAWLALERCPVGRW